MAANAIKEGKRYHAEATQPRQTIRPQVFKRLSLVRSEKGGLTGWPQHPDAPILKLLARVLEEDQDQRLCRLPRRDAVAVILGILIARWFQGNDATTLRALGELAGFSFPTVSNALQRLSDVVMRESDRSVRLARFPERHWRALIVNAQRLRSTLNYRDVSGTPMRQAALLNHLIRCNVSTVALGGTLAAQARFPEIDLVGAPRLDLCVHAPKMDVDLSFVEQMNPALEPVEDRLGPCDLALHFVRSADPMSFWIFMNWVSVSRHHLTAASAL